MIGKKFYSLGVFMLAGLALIIPGGYSCGFYGLSLVSMVLWLFARTALFRHDMRTFYFPLVAYAIGSTLIVLNQNFAAREVEPYLPFMLLCFGVWGIHRYKPKLDWLWFGISTGAIGAAVIAGYQSIFLGARADGHTNAIQFGNIALMLGVLCLVRAIVVFRFGWLNLLMWVGFGCGLAASVWSKTRGGWLAVVLILIWILINATKQWPRNRRLGVGVILIVCLTLPSIQPDGIVQSRLKEGAVQLKAFIETGEQNNSVGVRLALWSVGFDAIKHAPFFGHGDKGWVNERDLAIADGRLAPFAKEFSHLHNEYLNIAFKRGLIGLSLYLVMLLIPAIYFFRPLILHSSPDIRALSMAGMVVPMMYMDFALTQSFLVHNSGRMILCGVWMGIAALLVNALEDKNHFS